DIGRFIQTTIVAVESLYHLVGNENNREFALPQSKRRSKRHQKATKLSILDRVLTLLIDDQEVFFKWRLHLVRIAAIAGARCSACYRTHKPGQSVAQADDERRLSH